MMPAEAPSVPRCHGSSGKSAHVNRGIDTHYNAIKDVYVPGEFRRPDMNMNTVSMEQHGDDYTRPNADLETRLQIRSKEQLNVCIQNVLIV